MRRKHQPSRWGFSECPGNVPGQVDTASCAYTKDQLMLDNLMEMGFAWEEAAKLLNMREHLYENAEMCQRLADDSRLLFARWLYEQKEISEE